MSTEETPTPPPRMRVSLGNIRYFLSAVSAEAAIIAGLFLVLPFAYFIFFGACDGCTLGQHLLAAVRHTYRYGVGMFMALMLYFWFILVPAFMVLPLLGLILDCKRLGRDEA